MNVLYLSYDGMTDQLGQSQVIPYLAGLSSDGFSITLVSFEKADKFALQQEYIATLLKNYSIEWVPMSYSKWPPVLSTVWDIMRLRRKIKLLQKQKVYKIIHCRSYITALVGLELKRKQGLRFIFDMRGFWADERIEGHIWDLKNPFYKIVYNYFKRKERQFFESADQVISLTQNALQVIESWMLKGGEKIPIEVIPCCADLNHFNQESIDQQKKIDWKNKLQIGDGEFVISYLGAIGTWYMLEEMLDFFKCLSERKNNAKFLFITHEPQQVILEQIKRRNIAADKVIITPSSRNDLPALLSLTHLSVFFIRPSFSKKASSPTKQGEIMGMGIPIICNSGIGDTDRIIKESNAGIIINNFAEADYLPVIENLESLLKLDPAAIRAGAEKYYSLESGIERYKKIYSKLAC